MSIRPFDEVWSSYLAGEVLTAGEDDQIVAALSGDGRAGLFRDAQMDALLRLQARMHRDRDGFVECVMARLSNPLSLLEQPPPIPADLSPPGSASLEFELLPLRAQRQQPVRDFSPLVWLSALAAIVLVATLIALFAKPAENAKPTPVQPSIAKEQPKPSAPSPPAPPKQGVAQLKDAVECVWRNGGPSGDRLNPGAFELVSGKARISFDDGAEMEITGPAGFQILGANRAYLRRGQARTAVPEEAARFILETPTSLVLDRGTEFELQVADTGATDVRVLQGEIDLEARSLDGTPIITWRIGIGGTQHVEPLPRAPVPPATPPAGSFKGVLTINGERREFNNREEYERARRDVLRQFEEFQKRFLPGGAPQVPGKPGGAAPEPNQKQPDLRPPMNFEEAHRRMLEQFLEFQKRFMPGGGVPPAPRPDGAVQEPARKQPDHRPPMNFEEAKRRFLGQFLEFQKQFMPGAGQPPAPGTPSGGGSEPNSKKITRPPPMSFEMAHRRMLEQFQESQRRRQPKR
jgi:hypothetical protein